MSRTHAHRPWWAWAAVPQVMVERHDHTDGTCDLPPLDDWLEEIKAGGPWWPRGPVCRWVVDVHAVPPGCSCELCSQRDWHRLDVRAERRRVAAQLRRWQPGDDLGGAVPSSW